MSIIGIGGAGIPLPYPSALVGYPGFSGTNEVSLYGGQVLVLPAGTFWIAPGPSTFLQYLDPVSNLWVNGSTGLGSGRYVNSDGANWRLANLTGCPVGSVITNSGTGYTSAPTVTPSAGSSTWTAILGGALVTTSASASTLVNPTANQNVYTTGSGYTFPPTVTFSAPPQGGIQATGYCTISGGAVNSLVITNQGAGYTSAPTITFTAQPFDTSTSIVSATGIGGLVASGTAGGAQTVSAVVCTSPGTPQTSLITLSFAGGGGASAAATVVGCFAVQAAVVAAAGAGYLNFPYSITAIGGQTSATATVLNPAISTRFFTPRLANLGTATPTTGAFTSTTLASATPALASASNAIDPGLYQTVPATTAFGAIGPGGGTTAGNFSTLTMGAVWDISYVQPI